jgi:hypothetical protein
MRETLKLKFLVWKYLRLEHLKFAQEIHQKVSGNVKKKNI